MFDFYGVVCFADYFVSGAFVVNGLLDALQFVSVFVEEGYFVVACFVECGEASGCDAVESSNIERFLLELPSSWGVDEQSFCSRLEDDFIAFFDVVLLGPG